MKFDLGELKNLRKLEPLEVYLIAADNPIGRKQLRIIFRRKRSGEILTREQVTAIKRGRRVLRREMKERGLKRRIDFEITATNLGIYFDRNRLFWPFFLWLIRDNTVAKVLATTAVLTTLVTVTEPVIEYITQYITQYVTQIVTQYITQPVYIKEIVYQDRDRFTVSLTDEMFTKGLELSETPDFADPKEVLVCMPAWDAPCVSISEIPANIDSIKDGEHHDTYFAYTFYCRYINKDAEKENKQGLDSFDITKYAISYDWGIQISGEGLDSGYDDETTPTDPVTVEETEPTEETPEESENGIKVSDAVWIMVVQDGEVILCAKSRADGTTEMLPTEEILTTKKLAYVDRSVNYINAGLRKIHENLSMDNVYDLESVPGVKDNVDDYRKKIDQFFIDEDVSDLTQLMLRTEKGKDWKDRYKVVASRSGKDFYQVYPDMFEGDLVSNKTVVSRRRENVLPYLEDEPNMHKYTVVMWLEGDDPECTNELMGGHITLNFQIKGDKEAFMGEITETMPGTETIPETQPTEETEPTP